MTPAEVDEAKSILTIRGATRAADVTNILLKKFLEFVRCLRRICNEKAQVSYINKVIFAERYVIRDPKNRENSERFKFQLIAAVSAIFRLAGDLRLGICCL